MNIQEVEDKFYEAALAMQQKKGTVKIAIASKWDDNGWEAAKVTTAKNGTTFIFGSVSGDDGTSIVDPDTTEDLRAAIKGMFDAGTEDTDYNERTDLVFEKVPRVCNDCYWIDPDHC